MDRTAAFYSRASHAGGGFPIFSGSRRMRGGGIFGALARLVIPTVKRVGVSLLKKGARQAVGLAKDVAIDAMAGRNVKDSLKQHGIARAKNVGRAAITSLTSATARKASRKRKAPASRTRKTPAKKRARKGNF